MSYSREKPFSANNSFCFVPFQTSASVFVPKARPVRVPSPPRHLPTPFSMQHDVLVGVIMHPCTRVPPPPQVCQTHLRGTACAPGGCCRTGTGCHRSHKCRVLGNHKRAEEKRLMFLFLWSGHQNVIVLLGGGFNCHLSPSLAADASVQSGLQWILDTGCPRSR